MAADAEAVSAIPPGVLVTWAQRNDQVMVGVELPGCTSAECDFADGGVVQLTARAGVDGAETRLTLALRGAIVAADCTSRVAGRGVQLVLPKLKLGEWDRLLAGEKLANVRIDWGQWMDAAEEAEVRAKSACRAAPPPRAILQHRRKTRLSARARRAADSRQPDRPRRLPDERSDGCAARPRRANRCAERSAPTPPPRAGKDWGSNVQSGLDARQQARALDTSHDDDEDEEITLC